ncbi:MAG: hypothetical protein ACRC92_26540 [Peptostreptococcaceae bacterium]
MTKDEKKKSIINELKDSVNIGTYGLNTEVKNVLLNPSQDVDTNKLLAVLGRSDNGYRRQSELGVVGKDASGQDVGTLMNKVLEQIGNHEMIDANFHNRVAMYKENNFLVNNMPQLMEAIESRVEDILSPDTFAGEGLKMSLLGDNKDYTMTDIKDALEKHSMGMFLKEAIVKTEVHGHVYVYVCPFKETAKRLMNNVGGSMSNYTAPTSRRALRREENPFSKVVNMFSESEGGEEYVDLTPADLYEMNNMLQEAIADKVETPSELIMESPLAQVPDAQNYFTENPIIGEAKDALSSGIYEMFSESESNLGYDYTTKTRRMRKNMFDKMTGCYMSILQPERCVPVIINRKLLGLYYIERNHVGFSNFNRQRLGKYSNNLMGYDTFSDGSSMTDNPMMRENIIRDLSAIINKNLNEKFINNNRVVLDTIEHILNENNMFDMNFKVRFIPKEFLVEFKINPDSDGIGQTSLKKARVPAYYWIFLAKNRMMNKLFYEKDTLAIYTKQSVSKDIHANVMNAINHITKIIPIPSELTNLSKVYTGLSDMPRVVIPVSAQGTKPIELDRIEGQKVDPEDPFMEKLEALATRLVGQAVTLSDMTNRDVRFARTISFEDGKNVRRVLGKQDFYNPSINELYNKVVKFELSESVDLKVSLPTPAALSDDIANERTERISLKVDKIIANMYGAEIPEDKKPEAEYVRKELFKELTATSIPWDKIESIVEKYMLSVDKKTDDIDGEMGE